MPIERNTSKLYRSVPSASWRETERLCDLEIPNAQRFIDVVTPYVPEVMSYKIVNSRIDLLSAKRAEPTTLVGANTSVSG